MRAHQADDPTVLIVVGVKEQEFQFAIRSACRRRNLLYNGWQNSVQSTTCNITAIVSGRQQKPLE